MQHTLILLDLPRDPLACIASLVTNWTSFILACKAFEEFNTEETKLVKYCKVRSFRKKYPSIQLINPLNMAYRFRWTNFPNYLLSIEKPLMTCTKRCLINPFKDSLRDQPFKEALIIFIKVHSSKFFCYACSRGLCLLVSSRIDLNANDILQVYKEGGNTVYLPDDFIISACSNTALQLSELPILAKHDLAWRTAYTIGRRDDVTFDSIKKHPEILWKLSNLISRLKLTDEELDWMLNEIDCPENCLELAPNPHLTWDQMTRCYKHVKVNKDVGLMAWACTTFEKALSNLSSEIHKSTYFMEVLLNPNFTFKQVDILFDYKLRYEEELRLAQPVLTR